MPTLEWIGKDKVINHHQTVPFRVLERKYSFDESGQHEEDNGSGAETGNRPGGVDPYLAESGDGSTPENAGTEFMISDIRRPKKAAIHLKICYIGQV